MDFFRFFHIFRLPSRRRFDTLSTRRAEKGAVRSLTRETAMENVASPPEAEAPSWGLPPEGTRKAKLVRENEELLVEEASGPREGAPQTKSYLLRV